MTTNGTNGAARQGEVRSEYFNPFKKFTGIFIPDWLLESEGVSMNAKLIYALLCRYAGEDGKCYPSQSTLADKMKCTRRAVNNWLKELEEARMIERQRRFTDDGNYTSTLYRFLMHPDMQGGSELNSHGSEPPFTGVVNGRSHGLVNHRSHKENHIEENQLRETEIFEIYPKKAGKKAALKAISEALKEKDFEELADVVRRYAEAMRHTEPQYIPNPAKWFEEGRYDDDPAAWGGTPEEKKVVYHWPERYPNGNGAMPGVKWENW